ncbi:MAG: hypothetical protein KF799_08940 [Bdellovibrionales bacterium]|nr:hypothetical protein [Bdellovibrionales bacterium]
MNLVKELGLRGASMVLFVTNMAFASNLTIVDGTKVTTARITDVKITASGMVLGNGHGDCMISRERAFELQIDFSVVAGQIVQDIVDIKCTSGRLPEIIYKIPPN